MEYRPVQPINTSNNQHRRDSIDHWMIRLEKGEECIASLTHFCKTFSLHTGHINGIGAVREAEIGWFDPTKKQYSTRTLHENMEIVTLTGNLTMKEKEPFLHLHATFSKENLEVIGGHLFRAVISVTAEFFLQTFPVMLTRNKEEETGLFLWDGMLKIPKIG